MTCNPHWSRTRIPTRRSGPAWRGGDERGEGGGKQAAPGAGRGGCRGGSPSHRSATGGGGSALLAAPLSGAVLFLRRHTRKFPAPTLLLLLLPRGHAAPGAGHTPSRGSCLHTPPSRSLSPSCFPPPPPSLPHTLAGRGHGRGPPAAPGADRQPPERTCRRALATGARPEKMAAPSLFPSLSPSSPSPEGRGGGRRRLGNPSDRQDESSRVVRIVLNKNPRAGEGEAPCLPGSRGNRLKPTGQVPALSPPGLLAGAETVSSLTALNLCFNSLICCTNSLSSLEGAKEKCCRSQEVRAKIILG